MIERRNCKPGHAYRPYAYERHSAGGIQKSRVRKDIILSAWWKLFYVCGRCAGGHVVSLRKRLSRPSWIKIPGFILPFTGSIMEMLFGKMGGDTGRLAAGFGYYSSRKAQNHLGYRRS